MTSEGDPRPAYVQVAETLRREIGAGRFQPGERMPSVRDLSVRFSIAPVTTRHAMTLLRDAGWIYSQSTRGYFVREHLPDPATTSTVESSSEYLDLRKLLLGVQESVDSLSRRVDDLEARAEDVETAPPPKASVPARKARRSR